MLFYKKFLAIILAVLLLVLGVGCSGESSSAIIYYGVDEPPKNIDPQCAKTITELILVRNLFEGLMRRDENGNVVYGVIESYEKEYNTYTFYIKENAVWYDETPLTAHDFLFGFTRALSPETKSPNAECLYSIKNAKKIHNGEANANTLGVKVIDNHTLKIELDYDDENFLYTLTTAVAMPCNKEFFEKSIGKYGMSLDTVLCNGSYRLRKWSTEDFAMRIVKNTKYTGDFTPKNSAVYFSKNKDYTNLECLQKNYVDIAEIKTEDYNKAKTAGFNLNIVNNKALVLRLSKTFTKNMRDALFLSAISNNNFSVSPASFIFATSLFPDFFGKDNGKTYNKYNPVAAKELFNNEIKAFKNSDFPTETIYYYGDANIQSVVKSIAANWQKNLGAYVNISCTDNNSEAKSSALNDYGISVYTVETNEINMEEYLTNFDISNLSYNNTDALQNAVFANSYSIPVCFYGSCFANTEQLSGVKIDSMGGNIDFSIIIKKN